MFQMLHDFFFSHAVLLSSVVFAKSNITLASVLLFLTYLRHTMHTHISKTISSKAHIIFPYMLSLSLSLSLYGLFVC